MLHCDTPSERTRQGGSVDNRDLSGLCGAGWRTAAKFEGRCGANAAPGSTVVRRKKGIRCSIPGTLKFKLKL